MSTLPRATVHVDPTATAPGGGDKLICVLSACATQPDMTPRLYGSAKAISDVHGYCPGVEYAALHVQKTALPVLFAGMPIGTIGAVSRFTSFGNGGSSVVTVTAGSDGVLEEHDGVLRVVSGGTIGTDQIKLELSLDGGRSFKALRLGTATSYVLPLVNVTVSFAAGDLDTGDTIAEWHGSAPLIDASDLTAVREALASGNKLFRSILVCGDFDDATDVSALVTEVNAYATENERFVYARASVSDRLPQGALGHSYARLTGTPTLTFAEVGGTGDTVTRSTGSWIADGYVVGDSVTFAGTVSNNVTGPIAALTATVLTFGTTDLVAEVIAVDAGVTAVGGPTLTFAEVGGTGDTVTRNRGSWLADGLRVGDSVTFAGTVSNNVTGPIAALTATVLTFGTTDLVAEVIGSAGVACISGETKAVWMARQDDEFEDIDSEELIDLSAGRGSVFSPYSGWNHRRPAGWAASLREYQHDLHVATWRKDLGPVGFDLFDGDNELVEWDERVDGGAGSAARFTTMRTWANGPRGAFIALSLTRAGDGQIASLTHNQAVINAACNTVQVATENVIGRSLILNADGTATKDSLNVIASEVNAALELALLGTTGNEGPRASKAVWAPSPSDVYNVPEPTMHGTLELVLNGTVHSVDTAVRIRTGGQ